MGGRTDSHRGYSADPRVVQLRHGHCLFNIFNITIGSLGVIWDR